MEHSQHNLRVPVPAIESAGRTGDPSLPKAERDTIRSTFVPQDIRDRRSVFRNGQLELALIIYWSPYRMYTTRS